MGGAVEVLTDSQLTGCIKRIGGVRIIKPRPQLDKLYSSVVSFSKNQTAHV